MYETRRWLGDPFSEEVYNTKYIKTNYLIVHLSCLLWNSTRPSRQHAGGWTVDGMRRVGETGIEEVKKGRKEEARQYGRKGKGKREDERQGGGRKERARLANEAEE